MRDGKKLTSEEITLINEIVRNNGLVPGTAGSRTIIYDLTQESYAVINNTNGEFEYYSYTSPTFPKLLKKWLRGQEGVTVDHIFVKALLGAIEPCKAGFEPNLGKFFTDSADLYYNKFTENKTMLNLRDIVKDAPKLTGIEWIKEFPFINVLLRSITNNDEDALEYLINWLASSAVTRKKLITAIAFSGAQGSGKGLFSNFILSPIFGSKNTVEIGNSELASEFNEYVEDKMMLIMNELEADTRNKTINAKIKEMITEKSLMVNPKGKKRYKIKNHFNVMLFSNNPRPIRVEESDRRWTIIKTSDTMIEKVYEKDGYQKEEFLDEIKEEADRFIPALFRFDYDLNRANKVLNTDFKASISEGTSTKLEYLAIKLRRQDLDEVFRIIDDSAGADNGKYYMGTMNKKGVIADLKAEVEQAIAENRIFNETLHMLYKVCVDENATSNSAIRKWSEYLGSKSVSTSGRRHRPIYSSSMDSVSVVRYSDTKQFDIYASDYEVNQSDSEFADYNPDNFDNQICSELSEMNFDENSGEKDEL